MNVEPEFVIVVTKPDEPPAGAHGSTVRIGPVTKGRAEDWAAGLRMQLHSSAPQGTTVDVAPFDIHDEPFIHPDSIPRNLGALMEPFRADKGWPANGGFPDLYARLVMVLGDTDASELWRRACNEMDADAAYQQAQDGAETDLAEALDLLTQAGTAAQQAAFKARKALGTMDAWDFTVPADGHPEDALHHLEDAARSLRAAERVLRTDGAEGGQ